MVTVYIYIYCIYVIEIYMDACMHAWMNVCCIHIIALRIEYVCVTFLKCSFGYIVSGKITLVKRYDSVCFG